MITSYPVATTKKNYQTQNIAFSCFESGNMFCTINCSRYCKVKRRFKIKTRETTRRPWPDPTYPALLLSSSIEIGCQSLVHVDVTRKAIVIVSWETRTKKWIDEEMRRTYSDQDTA